MKILSSIASGWNSLIKPTQTLAINPLGDAKKRVLPWQMKSVARTRMDIKNWNKAIELTTAEEPKNFQLQLLFNEVMYDALLTSQIENRMSETLSSEFSIVNASGEQDEEQTLRLRKLPAYRSITKEILNSVYFGYSLVELQLVKQLNGEFDIIVTPIPRTNIVPQRGLFYPDYTEDKFINYRQMSEFGTWILEFDGQNLGLINKAVPHVLMKRFAQSCWSELCEIYGIPPRVLETNTQDPTMLARAEQMMRDTGAAAWYVIDQSEKFHWATGVSTNGDVYKNLISLCSNETSMLISGAIIGQDTVNGSKSKEETSQKRLSKLVASDKELVEMTWNNIVIPAMIKLGILKGDVRFQFDAVEDKTQLWTVTKECMPFMNVNPEFIKEKFGVDILSAKEPSNKGTLSFGEDFFV